jgi:hypothetical protein
MAIMVVVVVAVVDQEVVAIVVVDQEVVTIVVDQMNINLMYSDFN